MTRPSSLKISDYSYELPDERIARFPEQKRDGSMLLSCVHGSISHRPFRELTDELPEGALMIFNDTRVVRARLNFQKVTGAAIEIFCLEPLFPADYQLSFSCTDRVTWKCLVGNARKWKDEDLHLDIRTAEGETRVFAKKAAKDGNSYHIEFYWDNRNVSFASILESAGTMPIPPYLQREAVSEDNERYQTVYSKVKGSVAAPTAGLHFTGEVLNELTNKGIDTCDVTLHVGAGTFVPVKEENAVEHRMHEELAVVSADTIRKIQSHKGLRIAVGTTTTRTLESLYWLGVKLDAGYRPEAGGIAEVEQWDPWDFTDDGDLVKRMQTVLDFMAEAEMNEIIFRTGIMITPGYRFRVVGGLITNFHQPGSTLLLLIAAFIGERWREVYKYALQNGFRFLSYGDSSLLIP